MTWRQVERVNRSFRVPPVQKVTDAVDRRHDKRGAGVFLEPALKGTNMGHIRQSAEVIPSSLLACELSDGFGGRKSPFRTFAPGMGMLKATTGTKLSLRRVNPEAKEYSDPNQPPQARSWNVHILMVELWHGRKEVWQEPRLRKGVSNLLHNQYRNY